MGPDDAVEAVAMLKPKNVIPMHYNTWPVIAQDPEAFKQKVEHRLQVPVIVAKPGETLSLR
jgi:L-ascorbate metabolism protein UlaG (beta-lactamase superfamily)